ncbi:MAG: efflux RND transporter permease subunit [Bacteroidales bacterium]|nr:efflux RND transporter permease subunit [Bacteroidales bacterium]
MTRLVIKYRYLIIACSLLIAIGGILMMPGMETDPDIKNYIPENLESKINTALIEEEFGNQEMIMIVFEDSCILTTENLLAIKEISRQLDRLGSVDNTISLFNTRRIHGENGMMIVDPAVKRLPRRDGDIEILKKQLSANPLALGIVISDDFTFSSIAVTLSNAKPEEEALAEIEEIVLENNKASKVYFSGVPYVRKYIMSDVRRDGLILVPLALIIMLVFLWFAFREWKGMVLPFAMVVLSIAVAMGLAPLLGWKLSVISLLVPIMLIAVANDYGIHMIAKYQELNTTDYKGTNDQLVKTVLRKLRLPIIFTGLTTIAGILGLLTHSIIPARHVGVMASAGIAFAIILTLFMLPAWLSLTKRSSPIQLTKKGPNLIDRALSYLSVLVTKFPKRVLFISALVTLIFGLGITLIQVDGNMENFFPDKHPVKQASLIVNKHFGGTQNISVMIEGDIKDPDLLNILSSWKEEIEGMDGVGDVYSIASVIKEMSKALYEPEETGYDNIPYSRDAVAQVLEIYNMNGDPDDFERLVDFDYSKANFMIRFNNPETDAIRQVLDKLDFLSQRDKIDVVKGGYAFIDLEFADSIINGQLRSLVFAVIVILLLLSLIFKSFKGGLLSTIPILASVIFLLGFMGISGISLNSATALLSSIMIGVGVDYTIHFLWRYKSELKVMNKEDAVIKTLTTTGRGIVYNAFSVIVGFSVLVFSGFASIRFFGYLIVISIGICLISALFVIPSIMLVFKPKFIESHTKIRSIKIKPGKQMKKAVILILFIFISLFARSQETASDIMNRSREVMRVESFEAVSSLSITDSKGRTRERTNITASKTFADGTEKRLIRFLSPAEVEGTSMLIFDYDLGPDDMWIYLPALKRSRRIVSSDKGKSFMGSEFSNADMSAPPISDFKHKLHKTNSDQWIIDSSPADMDKEDEYGYIRKRSYVNRKTYLLSKMEFYNFDEELYKVIQIIDTRDLGNGKYIIAHMKAENLLKNRSSEIVMNEIRTGNNIKDEIFSLAYLER